jgi:hypothetical protein
VLGVSYFVLIGEREAERSTEERKKLRKGLQRAPTFQQLFCCEDWVGWLEIQSNSRRLLDFRKAGYSSAGQDEMECLEEPAADSADCACQVSTRIVVSRRHFISCPSPRTPIVVQDTGVPLNWACMRSEVNFISVCEWLKVVVIGHALDSSCWVISLRRSWSFVSLINTNRKITSVCSADQYLREFSRNNLFVWSARVVGPSDQVRGECLRLEIEEKPGGSLGENYLCTECFIFAITFSSINLGWFGVSGFRRISPARAVGSSPILCFLSVSGCIKFHIIFHYLCTHQLNLRTGNLKF